jgi:hypothetical protein
VDSVLTRIFGDRAPRKFEQDVSTDDSALVRDGVFPDSSSGHDANHQIEHLIYERRRGEFEKEWIVV